MKLSNVFNATVVAANYTEVASNSIPYLGLGFFPQRKKAGLDLKWIKGHNGLPISLAPSNFDAKSTFRDRVGISLSETRMAFFRESMLITEEDYQEILRANDSNDPYAQQVIDNIFDDSRTLVDGANVVPERMRMQLLAPLNGKVGIEIKANGVDYTYDYDPDETWKTEHYCKINTDADKWTAADTCDPIKDIETALDAQEDVSGNRPEILLMSKPTFNLIKNAAKVKSGVLAQNVTANVNYTTAVVRNYVEEALNISIVIYNKKFKNESGDVKNFYPDNIIMMLPNGAVGATWYGTTPEEARGAKNGESLSTVETGVSIKVTEVSDPENTKTTVSEVVLPSFERLNDCYALEVA